MESERQLHSHVWHLGRDVWEAKLSWDCQFEHLHMVFPGWLVSGKSNIFHGWLPTSKCSKRQEVEVYIHLEQHSVTSIIVNRSSSPGAHLVQGKCHRPDLSIERTEKNLQPFCNEPPRVSPQTLSERTRLHPLPQQMLTGWPLLSTGCRAGF